MNDALENNAIFASLDENDKRTFLGFIKNDLKKDDGDDARSRESRLEKMIDLVERTPGVARIDVKEAVNWTFLFEFLGHHFLFPILVLLICYGNAKTENEANLTLCLLKMLQEAYKCPDFYLCSSASVGVDWAPSRGWHLSQLALVCQCHPVLVDYLVDTNIAAEIFAKHLLLAAVLGRRIEVAQRIASTHPTAFLRRMNVRSKFHQEWNLRVDTSVFEVLFSKKETDWEMQLLDFFITNWEQSLGGQIIPPDPSLLRLCVTHEHSPTASTRKARMLSRILVRKKPTNFNMVSTNWSVEGLCCLMSELEANQFIEELALAVPEWMFEDEMVRRGYSSMVRT